MIAADGRTVWFQDTISMALAGNQVSKLRGVMVDITERKRAEEDRLAHVWFLESMDQINRAMQGTQTLDEMMRDVLDTVLAIFNCDRAWLLYPCDPETSSWRVPMERTRPGYPGALAWGLEVPSDLDIIHVFQIVRAASGPVKFGPGSEYPLPTEAKTRYQVQSELAMAIYPKVDKPYMFGLHQCAYARIWTEQEGRLFQEIGRRLGDALSTLLVYSNLQESEQR
jgi:hypothetical protein